MRKAAGIILSALVFAVPATAAMAPNYGGLSKGQEAHVVKIIQAQFGANWRTAVCIARVESGLNPRAANWGDSNGGSHGLFQINGIHRWAYGKGNHSIYNPRWNSFVAYRLSSGGTNWGAWTTAYRC